MIIWLGRVLGWLIVIVPAWFPVVCLVGRGRSIPRLSHGCLLTSPVGCCSLSIPWLDDWRLAAGSPVVVLRGLAGSLV